MYRLPKLKIAAKQFKLPLEEERLNRILNDENITIIDEKVFQDRTGDVVVYLKYEFLEQNTEEPTEDDFFEGDDTVWMKGKY